MPIDPLWLQNLDYPARIDRVLFDNLWTEGTLGAGSFAVTQSSPTAMSVQVAAGVAVVTGDNQTNQGKYLVRSDSVTTGVAISAAPGSGQRNDLVVLRVNDPNATGPAGDNAVIAVVTGTPSGSPVDPAVPATAVVLARVRVPAGTGSITNALIDDLRVASVSAHDVIPPGSVGVGDLDPTITGALVPTGTIVQYAGTAAPSGWLICDGTAYATATYPALSAVVAGAYDTSGGQAAPGAGQFRVPILSGRVAVGRTSGGTFPSLGLWGGAESVTLTTNQIPSHTHTQQAHTHLQNSHDHTISSDGSHSHNIRVAGTASAHDHFNSTTYVAGEPTIGATFNSSKSGVINSGGSHSHNSVSQTAVNQNATAVNNPEGGGQSHTNLQPYLVVNYIIKT